MISIFKEMWTPPKPEAAIELTRLFRSIEEGVKRRPGASVAITSPQRNDQVLRMSYDLAWVGSTLLGKRVLVLDAVGEPGQRPTARAWTPPRPDASPGRGATVDVPGRNGTDDPTRNGVGSGAGELEAGPAPSRALVDMDQALQERNNVDLLSLRISGGEAAIIPQLTEIWDKLQTTFDLIIVATPPVLNDPTAACLGAMVDGNVLLVSAGRTRQKEVTRAIDLLSGASTPLIGVVMTDRRHTFPRWLRWLFGDG